tara:strand:- start:2183 stop:2377 length:195 start_codon:yes stop_codon:yes gene_type:complete
VNRLQELIYWILSNAEIILIISILGLVFLLGRDLWRLLEREYWALNHKFSMIERRLYDLEKEKE